MKPKLCPSKVRLTAYPGGDVPIHGQCRVSLEHKSWKYQAMLIVVSSDVQLILGLEICEKLGLVKRMWTVMMHDQDDDQYMDNLGDTLVQMCASHTQNKVHVVLPGGLCGEYIDSK